MEKTEMRETYSRWTGFYGRAFLLYCIHQRVGLREEKSTAQACEAKDLEDVKPKIVDEAGHVPGYK